MLSTELAMGKLYIDGEDFVPLKAHENDPEGINLDTKIKHYIQNNQCRDYLNLNETKGVQNLEKKYGNLITRRSGATHLYNCHGMSFASRRTRIISNAALDLLLDDDEYKEVPRDKLLAGDVILYFGPKGDIEHSGIVVEVPDKQNGIPMVVSKWGSGPEYVHRANQCEYDFSLARYYRIMHGPQDKNDKPKQERTK